MGMFVWVPSTYIKPTMVVCIFNPIPREIETGESLRLVAIHSSQIDILKVQQDILTQKIRWGAIEVDTDTHLSPPAHMCIYSQAQVIYM